MASRASLNKVILIGNLTRDPELRYTPQGSAVCTLGMATNRSYVLADGQRKEETEFHRIVSWNKLAELCAQLLTKGRKVYVEGRLQTRSFQTPDGQQRQITEIVIDDMRILDSKRREGLEISEEEVEEIAEPIGGEPAVVQKPTQPSSEEREGEGEEKGKPKKAKTPPVKSKDQGKDGEKEEKDEDLDLSDLPF